MGFSIEWSKTAEKALGKLPNTVAARIACKVTEIQANPFRYLEHYEGEDTFKLRVDEYRLLIDADFIHRLLAIRVVGHRSKVYKR